MLSSNRLLITCCSKTGYWAKVLEAARQLGYLGAVF
jgi:hypothetical protein